MPWMKRMVLAAAGATLIACASSPLTAAPIGPAAASATAASTARDVVKVGGHWRGRRHGGWYGHRHHYRHRRHHGFSLFITAPVVVGPSHGYYDRSYDGYRIRDREGLTCYRICREEHGPDYCRDNWRRYCR